MPEDTRDQSGDQSDLIKQITAAMAPVISSSIAAQNKVFIDRLSAMESAMSEIKSSGSKGQKTAEDRDQDTSNDPPSESSDTSIKGMDMKTKALARKQALLEKTIEELTNQNRESTKRAEENAKKAAVSEAVSNQSLQWASGTVMELVRDKLLSNCRLTEDGRVVIGEDATPVQEYARNFYDSDPAFQKSVARNGSNNNDREYKQADKYKDAMSKPANKIGAEEREALVASLKGVYAR